MSELAEQGFVVKSGQMNRFIPDRRSGKQIYDTALKAVEEHIQGGGAPLNRFVSVYRAMKMPDTLVYKTAPSHVYRDTIYDLLSRSTKMWVIVRVDEENMRREVEKLSCQLTELRDLLNRRGKIRRFFQWLW